MLSRYKEELDQYVFYSIFIPKRYFKEISEVANLVYKLSIIDFLEATFHEEVLRINNNDNILINNFYTILLNNDITFHDEKIQLEDFIQVIVKFIEYDIAKIYTFFEDRNEIIQSDFQKTVIANHIRFQDEILIKYVLIGGISYSIFQNYTNMIRHSIRLVHREDENSQLFVHINKDPILNIQAYKKNKLEEI